MAVAVNLKKGNLIKKGVLGFSWTTFFFGFFVPLFRGDVMWAIVMLLAAICTMGLSNLVFCFIYNKRYTENLLKDGFEPAGDSERIVLKGYDLYTD